MFFYQDLVLIKIKNKLFFENEEILQKILCLDKIIVLLQKIIYI